MQACLLWHECTEPRIWSLLVWQGEQPPDALSPITPNPPYWQRATDALSPKKQALAECFPAGFVGVVAYDMSAEEVQPVSALSFEPGPPPVWTPTTVPEHGTACAAQILEGHVAPEDREAIGRFALHVNPPSVRGSLSKQEIRDVIGSHLGEVRACYEEAMVQAPNLEGRVVIKFIIAPDGRVSHAALKESNVANPALETCIVSAAKTWQYREPDGGGIVVVTYPFVLEQEKQ